MNIVFKATQIPGLYSDETDTEWRACYLPGLLSEASVDLVKSFNENAGIYIFALTAPVLDGDFIGKIQLFLKTTYNFDKQADHCFLWLNQGGNPDVEQKYSFGQAIIYDSSYSIKKNQQQVSQQLWFNNSDYFAVAPYSTVRLNDTSDGFMIQRSVISTAADYNYGLYLTRILSTESPVCLGNITRNDAHPDTEPPLQILFNSAGCSIQYSISFPLRFDDPEYYQIGQDLYPYNPSDNYTILPIGLKYYFGQDPTVTEITCRIFHNTEAVHFNALFHPGAIFNENYTCFRFENNYSLSTDIPTSFGKLITIAGCENSCLAFSKSPDRLKTAKSRYYWTVSGDFSLMGEPAAEQNRILCGLSGTETISFTGKNETYEGDRICFTNHQPAFAKVFPILNAQNEIEEAPLLSDEFTTAWLSLKKSSVNNNIPVSYYSQPEGAVLFNPGETDGVLQYAEVPSANLGEQQDSCFPMTNSATATPYLGVRTKGDPGYYDQETIRQFELQILNPARKQAISAAAKIRRSSARKTSGAVAATDNLSTTPQGLLVNLTEDRSGWQSLTLANPTVSGGEQVPPPLMFTNIDTEGADSGLQEAFQTNEQFLVISNPVPAEHIGFYNTYFENKIDVAAWPFIIDITGQSKWTGDGNSEFNNIVIFKFCNYSIEERIKNQKLWTDPLNFNQPDKLTLIGDWVSEYINTAKEAVDKDGSSSPFYNFVNIVTDKNWNGILCLQTTVDLSSLPKEIKAVLAGIDASRFTAHHFGIEANRIGLTAENKLDPDFKSSMFGLINYFNETYQAYIQKKIVPPVPLPVTSGDFDFQVLELQVLFDKSVVKDFKSKIQLNLNTLFNEPVVSESDPDNGSINRYSIVMDGLYDKKNGNTAYSFSIADTNTLGLSSVALSSVNVLSVQLATVAETDAGDITSRFYISGNLAFHQLENFDMFSYTSLPFSNLLLDMKFNLNRLGPDRTPKKIFRFDPTGIVFNKNNAAARPDSLASHFPLDLMNLLYNSPATAIKDTPAVTPASLAYIAVDAPLATLPVSSTWYALRFNVNLGSMGALTAKIGFNAEILLAWSPGLSGNCAQVFIKMPFSGSKPDKGFSLQGILKFAVGSIMFINTPAEGGEKPQYAMAFTQIGLSLMGLKLPRSGNTVFYLFGNPDGNVADTSNGNLGWFGAYQAEKEKN